MALSKADIAKRTFKENIEISNTSIPNPINSMWHKNEAWNYISNYNNWNNNKYKKSKKIIEKILNENSITTRPKLNLKFPNNTEMELDKEEFMKLLPDDFVWEPDDLFTNRIQELFYEFAAKRVDKQVEYASTTEVFDNKQYLKDAPWTILNKVFESLGLCYRFKNDYKFNTPNLEERPVLYQLLKNGEIDLNSPRELSDLSDGEKAIISLTFALINETRRPIEKLLLLDEFDNTLNPSLIESLFSVLDEFFIKKGITIIMTTHSAVTISLAPDYAKFYELFRQDDESPKIISVNRDEYTELKIANKNYYSKIADQENRIKELEKMNESLNYDKILFVEDEYTEIYKLAWLKLNGYEVEGKNVVSEFEINAPFKIFSKSNKDSLKGFLNNSFMDEWEGKKVVGLFDFDDAYKCFQSLKSSQTTEENLRWTETKGKEEECLYKTRYKYSNISAMILPVPSFRKNIAGIEQYVKLLEVELLFQDDDIKSVFNHGDYKEEPILNDIKIPKIGNKRDFWRKVINLDKEKFNSFRPLFKRIYELLDIK